MLVDGSGKQRRDNRPKKTTGFLPGSSPGRRRGSCASGRESPTSASGTRRRTLLGTLKGVAESAAETDSERRRLFADDAARGFAFIDLARTALDVVLMNPPFGLLTELGQCYLLSEYPSAHSDVFAAFVRRGQLLCSDGFVGAITSRSFLIAKRLETFRRIDVVPFLRYLWDLGLGVMDAASVESAAYVLGAPTPDFIAGSSRGLNGSLSELSMEWREVQREHLLKLPLARILYELPADVHRILSLPNHLEPEVATAREGMKTFDNERFVRLSWEVDPAKMGSHWWVRYAKGGQNTRIGARHPLVLNWREDGAELCEKNRQVNGTTAQVRQASKYWFRAGVTYSRRAPDFAPRFLPAGFIFSDKGPAILPLSGVSSLFLLGWLNSRLIRFLVHLQAHKQDFFTGIVKSLPWLEPSEATSRQIEAAVRGALQEWTRIQARDEFAVFS